MKVKINHDLVTMFVNLYFYEERGNQLLVVKPIELIYEEVSEAIQVEPTIRLSPRVAEELFQSMAETLDKQGIKTDKDAKLEGTLGATQYHLEDLRQLLKLKK